MGIFSATSLGQKIVKQSQSIASHLNGAGQYLAPLFIRLILFWEFWEAGMQKFNGENWFSHIQEKFPFPFNNISAELNWTLATYGELIMAALILVGLFTRFAALSLIIITAVATAAVHWPENWSSLSELWQGYAISDDGFGNFKLPLLFIILALPLLFNGGGKLSLDHLLNKTTQLGSSQPAFGLTSFAFGAIALGITLLFVMPMFAAIPLLGGILLYAFALFKGEAT